MHVESARVLRPFELAALADRHHGGAIWLAFAMMLGHYAVMFGVGGTLAVLLGLERGTVWDAPPAAFAVIAHALAWAVLGNI